MRAYDEGGRSDTARVIVTIRSDELPPHFVGAPYVFSLDDSDQPGEIIYTGIIARDSDGSVSG